jgi:hypothetical protein
MLLNTVDALLPPPSGPGAKSTAASSSPLAEISPDVGRKFRRTRVEAWAIVEKLKREHDEAREKETTGKSKAERAEEDRLRKKKEARDALSAKERTKVRTTPVLHEEAMRLLTPFLASLSTCSSRRRRSARRCSSSRRSCKRSEPGGRGRCRMPPATASPEPGAPALRIRRKRLPSRGGHHRSRG